MIEPVREIPLIPIAIAVITTIVTILIVVAYARFATRKTKHLTELASGFERELHTLRGRIGVIVGENNTLNNVVNNLLSKVRLR